MPPWKRSLLEITCQHADRICSNPSLRSVFESLVNTWLCDQSSSERENLVSKALSSFDQGRRPSEILWRLDPPSMMNLSMRDDLAEHSSRLDSDLESVMSRLTDRIEEELNQQNPNLTHDYGEKGFGRYLLGFTPFKNGVLKLFALAIPERFATLPHFHPPHLVETIVRGNLFEYRLGQALESGPLTIVAREAIPAGTKVQRNDPSGFPHIVVGKGPGITVCATVTAGLDAITLLDSQNLDQASILDCFESEAVDNLPALREMLFQS
jgi:hypothetical protein